MGRYTFLHILHNTYKHILEDTGQYFSVVIPHWRLEQESLLIYYYCHYSNNSLFRSYEIWIINRIWISTYFLCYVNGLAEVHQNSLMCVTDCFVSNLWILYTNGLKKVHLAQTSSFGATSARRRAQSENSFSTKTFLH